MRLREYRMDLVTNDMRQIRQFMALAAPPMTTTFPWAWSIFN